MGYPHLEAHLIFQGIQMPWKESTKWKVFSVYSQSFYFKFQSYELNIYHLNCT